MNLKMKILFFLKAVVFAQLIPQEIRVHVAVTLGVYAFAQLVGNIKQVRATLHAFKAVENGEVVNPLRQFRESRVAKAVLAAGLQVFQVTVGNAVAVFDKDVHRMREQLFAGQVFVHDNAEAKVVHRGR